MVVHRTWADWTSSGSRPRWRCETSGIRRRTSHDSLSRCTSPNITQRVSALRNGDAVPFATDRPRLRAVAVTSSS